MKTFDPDSFKKACKILADKHPCIKGIIHMYGMPPMYQRPFAFDTLVQIILEQQVSLASAKAAFNRLISRMGSITPHGLLQMDRDALRECTVSRQKAGYLHHLSETVITGKLNIASIPELSDDEVRAQLMQVKGIGPWTADVVLMLCLQRCDVFPLGDVALVNSIKHELNKTDWTLADIGAYADRYAPYRTIAAYCYWHAYILRKNINAGFT